VVEVECEAESEVLRKGPGTLGAEAANPPSDGGYRWVEVPCLDRDRDPPHLQVGEDEDEAKDTPDGPR